MKNIDIQIDALAKRIKNKKNFNQKSGILILFFSDWKAKEGKISFLDFFKTTIDTYYLQSLKKGKLKKEFSNTEDYLIKEKFFSKVSNIYEEEGIEELEKFLDEAFSYADSNSFKFYGGNAAGVISYDEIAIDKNNKQYIQLHFKPKEINQNFGKISYEESLAILAQKIIDRGEYIDYIKRFTWMASMKKSKDFGFVVTSADHLDIYDIAFWGQFFTTDGELRKDRFKFLLENNYLKYPIVEAEMSFVDLVYKYLPEKRGKQIKLKKVNNKYLSLVYDHKFYISKNIEILNSLLVHGNVDGVMDFLKQNEIYNRIFIENKDIEIKFLNFLSWLLENKINFSEYKKKIGPELELGLEEESEKILEKLRRNPKYYNEITIEISRELE